MCKFGLLEGKKSFENSWFINWQSLETRMHRQIMRAELGIENGYMGEETDTLRYRNHPINILGELQNQPHD